MEASLLYVVPGPRGLLSVTEKPYLKLGDDQKRHAKTREGKGGK